MLLATLDAASAADFAEMTDAAPSKGTITGVAAIQDRWVAVCLNTAVVVWEWDAARLKLGQHVVWRPPVYQECSGVRACGRGFAVALCRKHQRTQEPSGLNVEVQAGSFCWSAGSAMVGGSIAWWHRGNTASTVFAVQPAAVVDKSACAGVVASRPSACASVVGFALIRMVHDADEIPTDADETQTCQNSQNFSIQSDVMRIGCRKSERECERECERERETIESEGAGVDAFVVDDARGVLLAATAGRLVVIITANFDERKSVENTLAPKTPTTPTTHSIVDYFPTPHSMVLSSDGRMLVTGHTTCARVWSTASLMQIARTATRKPPKCLRLCYGSTVRGSSGGHGGAMDCETYVYVSCALMSASCLPQTCAAETRTAGTVETCDLIKADLKVWTSGHMYPSSLRAWHVRLGSCKGDTPLLVDLKPDAAFQAHRYSTQTCFVEGPQVLVYGPQLCCDPLMN